MDSQLKCQISAGQFPSEVSVRGFDFAGEEYSLFVAKRFTNAPEVVGDEWIEGFLQVEILDSQEGWHLVCLPGQTFSNGQSITVRSDQLVPCQPKQHA